MSNIPKRIQNCTTHHFACDCREYQFMQMETALKVIQTWAKVAAEHAGDPITAKEFRDIVEKALKALKAPESSRDLG